MREAEAKTMLALIEDHWGKHLDIARAIWLRYLEQKEADVVLRSIEHLALKSKWMPSLAELGEVIVMYAPEQPQLEEAVHADPLPDWVKRWNLARAAGDTRLIVEQIPGIYELHLFHGEPSGSESKYPGSPSGYEPQIRIIESHKISEREFFVQPDEYASA